MNLLIGTIYADIAKDVTNLATDYPGCPYQDKPVLLADLDQITAFQDQSSVNEYVDAGAPFDECKAVRWIALTYGHMIVAAEGDPKIPGFKKSVPQFIIAQPHPDVNKAWEQEFKKDKDTSIPLFHGTAYIHLQSILRNGFYAQASMNGLFSAEEPGTASGYASYQSGRTKTDASGQDLGSWGQLKVWKK